MNNRLTNEMIETKVEHFGIQRKIVAHMTSRSWQEIPHVSVVYEPDVTDFFETFKILQKQRIDQGKGKLTFNTIMLRVVAEGLKAAPQLNSTLEFNPKSVTGVLTRREDIDVSIPWTLPTGEMMTLTLPDIHNDNLDAISKKLAKIANKVANTNCTEAMYEVSFDQTLSEIKKGHFGVLRRIFAAKVGKHRVRLLSGDEKKKYYEIPEDDRLTLRDIKQGTLTVSNIGSVHRTLRGNLAMLEIIPPQIFTMAICNTQMKPVCVKQADGSYEVMPRTVCPMCLAVDHRAAEYGDLVPFMDRLDDIFARPEQILNW